MPVTNIIKSCGLHQLHKYVKKPLLHHYGFAATADPIENCHSLQHQRPLGGGFMKTYLKMHYDMTTV